MSCACSPGTSDGPAGARWRGDGPAGGRGYDGVGAELPPVMTLSPKVILRRELAPIDPTLHPVASVFGATETITEAFPNAFLGVMVEERYIDQMPELKRGQ